MKTEWWTLAYLVAIAHVWVRGTIFEGVRTIGLIPGGSERMQAWRDATALGWLLAWWRKLANCPLCSGFWIGVLGEHASHYYPAALRALGVGALVGTLALALCGLIRRI